MKADYILLKYSQDQSHGEILNISGVHKLPPFLTRVTHNFEASHITVIRAASMSASSDTQGGRLVQVMSCRSIFCCSVGCASLTKWVMKWASIFWLHYLEDS